MLCLTGLVTMKSLNHGSTSGHFQSTKVGCGKYNWKTKGKSIQFQMLEKWKFLQLLMVVVLMNYGIKQ